MPRLCTASPPADATPQSAMTRSLITRASPSLLAGRARTHTAASSAHERRRTRRTVLSVLLHFPGPGGWGEQRELRQVRGTGKEEKEVGELHFQKNLQRFRWSFKDSELSLLGRRYFCLCFFLYHAIVRRDLMGIIRISGNVLYFQHFSSKKKNSTLNG